MIEVSKDSNSPLGIAFVAEKKLEHHEAWLGTAASMLALGMAACDDIDSKRRMKNQLQRAADRLGVSMTIGLAQPGS